MHCHLDLYEDSQYLLKEIERRGTYVLAVTTTPKAFLGNHKIFGQSKRIRIAVGLHPELVAQRFDEGDELLRLIEKTKYVGEVGLDGGREFGSSYLLQVNIFRSVLSKCAELGGRLISIHSRFAADAVLGCIADAGFIGQPILHWFTGDEKQALKAVELGCYFSVGPAMLTNKKGRALAATFPLDRILLETDGPFGRVRGKMLMPWDSEAAVPLLADIYRIPESELIIQIRENLRRISACTSEYVASLPY